MKQYFSLFRIRFINGLQYRTAAFVGSIAQLIWGFMEILAFLAFYHTNPSAFPMEFSQLVSYIWIQQAFLVIFVPWGVNSDSIETIVSGNISYNLARPMDIYNRWFFEIIAERLSNTALRCGTTLVIAFMLPYPFGIALPSSLFQFLMFFISINMSMLVATAYCLIDSISTFYTMSRNNSIFKVLAVFFSGGCIPIPFFPESLKKIVELLPFAAMQNMPLRIYSGNISGKDAINGIALQIFWFVIMVVFGKFFMKNSLKRVVSQGG